MKGKLFMIALTGILALNQGCSQKKETEKETGEKSNKALSLIMVFCKKRLAIYRIASLFQIVYNRFYLSITILPYPFLKYWSVLSTPS